MTQAARPTARAGVAGGWADASLHNAPLTADLIEGARLQPASFAKLWAELSEAEQVAAADLGLEDVGDWAERYDVDWLPWLELSSRQREGAMSLGFDEPRLWPPRSVTTASLIEGNFSAPTLKRFLQCRQIKPIPQDKRARAKAARSIIQEEAVVLARDGAQALSLFSPEGKSYAELAAAKGRLNLDSFANYALDPPAPQHWEGNHELILRGAAFLTEEMAAAAFHEDPLFGGAHSREVDEGCERIMCLRDPMKLQLEWCVDPADDSRHWFRMQVPTSMSVEAGLEPQRFECSLAVQTVPADPPDCDVPRATQVLKTECPCDYGKDQCLHTRALALAVSQLIRPDDVRVPEESTTLGENCWRPPKAGRSFSITSTNSARPFINNSRRHRDRRKPGKKKGRRAVLLPVAAAQYYDPCPDGAADTLAYDDPARCEMRAYTYDQAKVKSGKQCAHQRLYGGRQRTGEFEADVRAEGERKRKFWTVEEETAEHRRVRAEIRREQQQTGDGAPLVVVDGGHTANTPRLTLVSMGISMEASLLVSVVMTLRPSARHQPKGARGRPPAAHTSYRWRTACC